MFLAVALISLENANKPTYDEITGENPRFFAFLSILFGVVAPMTFAWKAYFTRLISKYKYDTWTVVIDNYIIEFVVYGVLFFFYVGFNHNELTWSKFLIGTLAGICTLGGKMGAFYAFKEGNGGVANSLLQL